jgi:hypothetical protein
MSRSMHTKTHASSPLLLALAAFGLVAVVGCSSAPSGGEDTGTSTGAINPIASSALVGHYDVSAAVTYADGHWDDGVGECDEFVNDAAVTTGGLNIPFSTWVPTTWGYLDSAKAPYDEYSPSNPTVTGGCPGDIVIYSNDVGASFCLSSSQSESNCGHVGLVVVGGSSAGSILADFHNNAHYHLALSDILSSSVVNASAEDGYSTFRLYHLSNCSAYPSGTPGCSSDTTCNQGVSGTGLVCSNTGPTAGQCIKGCHGDSDCPSGNSCDTTQSPWTCVPSPSQPTGCTSGDCSDAGGGSDDSGYGYDSGLGEAGDAGYDAGYDAGFDSGYDDAGYEDSGWFDAGTYGDDAGAYGDDAGSDDSGMAQQQRSTGRR